MERKREKQKKNINEIIVLTIKHTTTIDGKHNDCVCIRFSLWWKLRPIGVVDIVEWCILTIKYTYSFVIYLFKDMTGLIVTCIWRRPRQPKKNTRKAFSSLSHFVDKVFHRCRVTTCWCARRRRVLLLSFSLCFGVSNYAHANNAFCMTQVERERHRERNNFVVFELNYDESITKCIWFCSFSFTLVIFVNFFCSVVDFVNSVLGSTK